MLSKVMFIFILVGISWGNGPNKLNMTVLYESKCPDSREFVLRQLQPVMQLLHDEVQLKLVPFGKADSINSGYGGFQCQHGPTECLGNVVQDCALSVMVDRTDLEKTEYVACEMSTLAGAKGSLKCVQQANVSADQVHECVRSDRGLLLQLQSEQVTKQYRPKFIPTVIINGIEEEDPPIQVERSKALHELVESHRNDKSSLKEHNDAGSATVLSPTVSADGSDYYENDSNTLEKNPNILNLTKMKWLTEDQPGSPDSSSPNVTPALSSTSTNCSRESDSDLPTSYSSDRYLSTILRLDKEHNLFGLSNLAIVGSRPSRKIKSQDDRPVFHQTAIVQVCCGQGCCRHTSRTDLPSSLKCPTCRPCCVDLMGCSSCAIPCPTPYCPPSSACPVCSSAKCASDGPNSFGLTISIVRKPKFEPEPIEITPRSSCVLQKPFAARTCHHCPPCVPPSSCFPYLMPCFWPSRSGAPCNNPSQCFHNPPCRPPRKTGPPSAGTPEVCPPKCEATPQKCVNKSCFGKNAEFAKELEKHFKMKSKKSI